MTCREGGREDGLARWRTFRLTLSKSFSHPDNDLARARWKETFHGLKMKIPAIANVLRATLRPRSSLPPSAPQSLLSRQ